MRRTSGLLLVLGILAIGVVSVSAGGPYHEEGWFSSLAHRIGSMMPWGSKLGHDHADTLAKVESIYEKTHEAAQRRVDELKENIVKDSDIQKLIADIYHEEAQRAEKEIEGLKHPMLEWLMHWRNKAGDVADKASDAAKTGLAAKLTSDLADLPSKVTGHYKSALESAKSAAASLPATPSWEEAKQKAHEVYSHAFHKGHGETRTFLGKMRDTLGRGASSTASMAKSAACHTWDFLTHSILAGLYLVAGAGLGCWAVAFWNRRKFEKQLDSHVSGPIIAVGEYMMVGGEETQRKFYDFWSGAAATYFNRQPGLRRQYMHRGVPGAGNMWLSYSEWATIDDLRRAVRNHEFIELKKRAPKATVHKMTLYQLGASGARHEVDGDASKETAEQRGLRQRTGTSTS